ncbi:response regulator transcription factor [Nostoc paludosum FACHB-159]|uniref:Response regulator transcription factor n=1 Tax=Nostoc paludosum FACHB-159 TaxID=2692908 RepID=A0ABR8K1E9_9NOSO|nr:response regulator transcription factor [Nostoc sp. FACHB-857]MBD2732584.1 response regulator transcription factor [Nostoc paludosum FACHB-159]
MTVDDHQILRGGIKFLLLAFDDIELVGEAGNGDEALRLCENLQPDVVLMDLMMGMNGAEVTKVIRKKYPKIQVLILTSFLDKGLVQKAMQAGAIGYLLKGVSIDELANAIRCAAIGRSILSAEVIQALLQPTQPSSPPAYKLSRRQAEVLTLLALGLSNEEIAQRMKLSPSTIRHHVSQVLNKLGATNRTEAATRAVRVGCV